MAGEQNAAPLSWGLKESFRNYVESAGGTIEVGGGASRAADGTFDFTAAPGAGLKLGADGKPQGTAQFTGEVKCEAHGGMLKVFLADPAVEIDAEKAVITAADSAARDRRVDLAILDLAAATRDGDTLVIPTKLSRDGWRIIGDHYLPSTPLDPVRIRVGG